MKTWAFIYDPLFNIAAKHFDGILQKNQKIMHELIVNIE